MLDSYVCNHSLLGADFGQSAIRCARNKVGEKAWSISYIYRNIQLSLLKTGRKPSALHSLLACFLLELVQAFPGTMNSSATKKLVHLKAGKILSFRSTCISEMPASLECSRARRVISLCGQSRGRMERQPSCSEVRQSTVTGQSWKQSGAHYLTISPCLCPSGILVA